MPIGLGLAGSAIDGQTITYSNGTDTLEVAYGTGNICTLLRHRTGADVVLSLGVVQGAVSDPAFIWSGASDSLSGVAGYYVYWGMSSNGTSTAFQAGTTYDPTAVASGTIYYLRVQTRDHPNNTASWVTLYEFRQLVLRRDDNGRIEIVITRCENSRH